MGLSKYSIKLFLYLMIISATGFFFFWSLDSSQLIITKLIIGALFITIFLLLLRYLNKTNQDLIRFLEAIKYAENISSHDSSGLSFDQLNVTYNEITKQLKDAWLAKEFEHQYFLQTIENVDVGIISFDESGNVELFNQTGKNLLGVTNINNIDELDTELGQFGNVFRELKPGKSQLIKLNTNVDQLHILAKVVLLKLRNKQLKLVSFQDIKTQLEQSELEAWQKLIKVLTHEIMNSVTPIKSLTYSMQKVLNSEDQKETMNKSLLKGLNAIEKRSKGLLDFVESYKNLTQIKKPVYERVYIKSLIENIIQLLKQELENKNVNLRIDIQPKDISVIADEKLLSQVIVNLILNSLKAYNSTSNNVLELKAKLVGKNAVIQLRDNGKGISPGVIDQIFVPFFSTYEDGSGIGLSFARQVMVLHNGRIEVQSIEGEETTFTLIF